MDNTELSGTSELKVPDEADTEMAMNDSIIADPYQFSADIKPLVAKHCQFKSIDYGTFDYALTIYNLDNLRNYANDVQFNFEECEKLERWLYERRKSMLRGLKNQHTKDATKVVIQTDRIDVFDRIEEECVRIQGNLLILKERVIGIINKIADEVKKKSKSDVVPPPVNAPLAANPLVSTVLTTTSVPKFAKSLKLVSPENDQAKKYNSENIVMGLNVLFNFLDKHLAKPLRSTTKELDSFKWLK